LPRHPPSASPVRMTAATARMRPAGPRTSARGLVRLRRRRLYSVRSSALVPNRMCAGLVQPAKSDWWHSTVSSAPDHPSRGMIPYSSWYANRCAGTMPRRDGPGRPAARKEPCPADETLPRQPCPDDPGVSVGLRFEPRHDRGVVEPGPVTAVRGPGSVAAGRSGRVARPRGPSWRRASRAASARR